MEPNHNSFAGGAELPQPQEVTSGHGTENNPVLTPEVQTTPASGSTSVSAQPYDPSVATGTVPLPQAVGPTPSLHPGTQQLIADDSDLIEKEWVVKAKAIVSQTRDDPNLQTKEITKVRADYLKKRYNKDLKVSET